jgi:hypothetical protein
MEDTMTEVSDFSKYTEAQLRKLLIDNAKPACSGMSGVVRAIEKKYNNCDREMLLWFINQPPYNGKLWASEPPRVVTEREERRIEAAIERMMRAKREKKPAVKVKQVIKPPLVRAKQLYAPPTDIMGMLYSLGCKPVLIADKVVGISRKTSAVAKVCARFPDWKVVTVYG